MIIIIPARFASARFPGKPLALLRGPDGEAKSLIRRSWEAAMAVRGVEAVHVATDDPRIADHVGSFGGSVVMTSPNCANGTERCAEAIGLIGGEADIVINFQGDAPLTPAWFAEDLIAAMRTRSDIDMATPVLRCDRRAWEDLRADRAAGRIGGTTAVMGAGGQALYFSKEVIPWIDPAKAIGLAQLPVFHHVGVYAYRPEVLRAYRGWPVGSLEAAEGLEQLRFIENGRPVLCVECDARGRVFWELNNPEDVERIERAMHDTHAPA